MQKPENMLTPNRFFCIVVELYRKKVNWVENSGDYCACWHFVPAVPGGVCCQIGKVPGRDGLYQYGAGTVQCCIQKALETGKTASLALAAVFYPEILIKQPIKSIFSGLEKEMTPDRLTSSL